MFKDQVVFKYYQFLLTDFIGVTRVYTLTEDEFNNKKEVINWLDFLIQTGQWIPYDLYHDLFGIPESLYDGIENVEKIEVKFIENVITCKDIDLDSI